MISLEPSAENIPVKFRCYQFPVWLAFAMTNNKSQGQSVANVGLDLHTLVFPHGQLYFFSCCTSESQVKVLFPENEKGTKTVNIVWSQIFVGVVWWLYYLWINLFWICHWIYYSLRLNTNGPLRNEGYLCYLVSIDWIWSLHWLILALQTRTQY